MASTENESRGTISLVLGILSLLCLGFLAGIPAWILGNRVMAERPPSDGQYGLGKIGKILGIIGTILSILGLLWSVFVMVVGVGGAVAASSVPH